MQKSIIFPNQSLNFGTLKDEKKHDPPEPIPKF